VTDPETGEVTNSLTDVYAGPCKVQQTIAQSSNPVAGEHRFTVQSARLDIPVSVVGVRVGDVAVASFLDTATYPDGTFPSDSLYPAAVREATFRVVELFEKSYATAQRLRVEQVVG
jgi:polyisoprenoid-binding protein YceI